MRSRQIKYFAAMKIPCNIHIAWTRYQPDQYVRANMSREEVFSHFQLQTDVVLFDNAASAERYADKQYYATAKRNSYGMFEENPQKKSNDAQLLQIYGDDMVRMRVVPVTVLYQLEGDEALKDTCEHVRHNDEIYRGYKVTGVDKDKLTLEFATVQGLVVHVTDAVAKRDNCPVSVETLDHKQLSVKQNGCMIL
jgi:hypothetical protein